jgi:hypothetical protein
MLGRAKWLQRGSMGHDGDVLSGLVDELRAIREAVKRKVPDHRNPEAIHEVKSDVTHRLTSVMNTINRGIPLHDSNESK